MKKIAILSCLLFTVFSFSQQNIDELLVAGTNDARRFAADYIAPVNEGLAYGINFGWFNNAVTPKKYAFEFSVIGNASFIKDEKKSFRLNAADYENISFEDNSSSKMVATALGHNSPPERVVLNYDNPIFGTQSVVFELPTGIGSKNINTIPSFFLQGSFSPFNGTQIKVRYFPRIKREDANVGLYGFGLQQDFTRLFSDTSSFPLSISGLIAYTHLSGDYDFTDQGFVNGQNQKIETETNTMLYEFIVATKLKVLNFYGSVGYLNGTTNTNLLGTYVVTDGTTSGAAIVDPFSIESDSSGILTTLGANLKLGFFGLNASYTIAEFNNASLGINFVIE